MREKDFKLIGHNNPLGYPAPVIPIGILNNELVAIYASDRATETVISKNSKFVKHDENLTEFLMGFDYKNNRLFGFNMRKVELYSIDEESQYFVNLLKNANFSEENPFMRLVLAKTLGLDILAQEIARCGQYLENTNPDFVFHWYKEQVVDITTSYNLSENTYFAETWDEFKGFFFTLKKKTDFSNGVNSFNQTEFQKQSNRLVLGINQKGVDIMETKKWEYKWLKGKYGEVSQDEVEKGVVGIDELNKLGDEGWELVSCYTHGNLLHNFSFMVFKRQKA